MDSVTPLSVLQLDGILLEKYGFSLLMIERSTDKSVEEQALIYCWSIAHLLYT